MTVSSASHFDGKAPPRRLVVKLGTGVLTSGVGQLDTPHREYVRQIAAFRAQGTEVIVVSSGAVGLGMGRLGLGKRPRFVQETGLRAVGQSCSCKPWQRGFEPHGTHRRAGAVDA